MSRPQHVCAAGLAILNRDKVRKFHLDFCGEAIYQIEYDTEGKAWFAHNREYGTPVLFCPWCGLKLEERWGGQT